MYYWLLCTNSALARLVRTILQGLIAFLVAYLPSLLDMWEVPEALALAIIPAVMAILSPVMAKLGDYLNEQGGDYYVS